MLVAQRTHLLQILSGRYMHAALTLDRLQQNSADIIIHLSLQRLDIAVGHKHMSGAQRTVAHMIIIMAGSSQRIKGASVEGFVRRNNFIFRRCFAHAILTRQLHSALIALCATVGKENAVHAGSLGHHAQGLRLNLSIIQVGAVHQLASLLTDSLHQHRMIITKAVDSNTGKGIHILIALVVPHTAALAKLHNHLISAENRQIIFFCFFYNSFFIHCQEYLPLMQNPCYQISLTTSVPTPLSLKSSIRIECSARPSIICVFLAPPLKALMQERTLGIMPPSMLPLRISS